MRRFTQFMFLALAVLMIAPVTTEAKKNNQKVKIVAHRGFWNCDDAGYAKNSVAALRCAQEAGFWGSEFDVNMTSDGVLLVYHDGNVEGKSIEKNPYSEFKDFKLKNGENIPTLDQYLEQAKKYPNTVLVYELKPHSRAEVEDRFIDLTIKKLQEYELLDPRKVIFISFSYHMCEQLAKLLPEFTVQYLNGDKSPAELHQKGINGIDYSLGTMRQHPEWCKEAHKLGMTSNVWTINTADETRECHKWEAGHITSDTPLDTRAVLKSLKTKEKKNKIEKKWK